MTILADLWYVSWVQLQLPEDHGRIEMRKLVGLGVLAVVGLGGCRPVAAGGSLMGVGQPSDAQINGCENAGGAVVAPNWPRWTCVLVNPDGSPVRSIRFAGDDAHIVDSSDGSDG